MPHSSGRIIGYLVHHIMNRLLSGLRSGRALKSIELSRGLGAAEDYGDFNWGSGLGQFTMAVLSGLRAGGNGGGTSMRKVLLPLNGLERAAESGFVGPDTNGLVSTAGSGDQEPCLERCHSVLSCRWSGGLRDVRDGRCQYGDHAQPPLLARGATLDVDAGDPQHHVLDRLGLRWFRLGLIEQRPAAW